MNRQGHIQKKKVTVKESIIILIILLVSAYLLTRRGWEPTGEYYKMWFGARLLIESFEFSQFTHGPLYILYLSLFKLLPYPLSFFTEYIITHLFCYFSLYFLLRQKLSQILSLLLVIGWIPYLSDIEGAHVLFAMGFISIYFCGLYNSAYVNNRVPIPLFCSALSNPICVPFFVCHMISSTYFSWGTKKNNNKKSSNSGGSNVPILGLRLGLLLLTCLTFLFKSDHPLNSQISGVEEDYAPVSMDGFNGPFFQIGLIKEFKRTIPESEKTYHDWYFTKNEIYGDAENFIEAAINNPNVFFRNIIENGIAFSVLGKHLMWGYDWSPPAGMVFNIISYLLIFIGLSQLTKIAHQNKKIEYIISIIIGTLSCFGVLFLTQFSLRYSIILLPVSFLLISNIPAGIFFVYNKLKSHKNGLALISEMDKSLVIIGIFVLTLMTLIFFMIIPQLFNLIPMDKKNSLIITSVIALLIYLLLIYLILMKSNHIRQFFLGWFKPESIKCPQIIINSFILLIFIILIWNAPHPFKTQWVSKHSSIKNWLVGKYLFQSEVSLIKAHPALLDGVDKKNTRILTTEDAIWALGAVDLRLDGIYTAFKLPPFNIDYAEVETFLNSMDEIWINKNDAVPHYTYSTEDHLRFKLHISPFLEKNIKHNNWIKKDIDNFGHRYIKK